MRKAMLWTAFIAIGICGLPAPRAAAGDKPVVVVFDIKNRNTWLKKRNLVMLGDYLATRLMAAGVFQIVPREDLRSLLRKQKIASFKECYSQESQIELGGELAAQSTVATQVMRLGKKCVVTANLFDLREEVAKTAGIGTCRCTEGGFKEAIDSVAEQLSGTGKLKGEWASNEGLTSGKLAVRVWTDRGQGGVYYEGEQLFVFLKANRDCYVRLVYQQVDGTKIQIFPNSLHGEYKIKGGVVWPVPGVNDDFEFEVTEPFGAETITAYASTRKFPKIQGTVTDSGLKVLGADMEQVYTRGIKVKKAETQFARASTTLKTAKKL